MRILAFDTSGPWCAAALLNGDRIVVSRHEEMKRGQAERLMEMLGVAMVAAGIVWQDLDGLGVGIGPGNFTGIRVSVAAARGLALGLGVPSTGVSTFETTRSLANRAQVAVPAPRETAYFMDFDRMQKAEVVSGPAIADAALSTDFAPLEHVECIARLTAARLGQARDIPRPSPLYIRPADADLPSTPPPQIIP